MRRTARCKVWNRVWHLQDRRHARRPEAHRRNCRCARHLPVTMTLFFRRFQFCQPKTSHPWPQWKCRLLGERLAQQGPDAQAYIADVTDSLNAMSTFTPSQVNRILLDAGQRHFQISRPSSLRPPWQDVQHVGNIRDMWKQYRPPPRQRATGKSERILKEVLRVLPLHRTMT